MKPFRIISANVDVLVRYEGYDGGTETNDVVIEAWRPNEDEELYYLSERIQFPNEEVALEYINQYTEKSAAAFLTRNEF